MPSMLSYGYNDNVTDYLLAISVMLKHFVKLTKNTQPLRLISSHESDQGSTLCWKLWLGG